MRFWDYYLQYRGPRHFVIDMQRLDRQRLAADDNHADASVFRNSGDSTAILAIRALRLSRPCFVTDAGNAATAHEIRETFCIIRRGHVTAQIAGGAAALVCPVAILAFILLGALSHNANPAEASRLSIGCGTDCDE